jgi:predicted GIY-YIG superfamily endonuclease
MKNYVVYVHIFPNNKKYVGITSQDVNRRWKNGKGYQNQIINSAIQKYGWHNTEHKILYTNLTKEEAEQKEIELISEWQTNKKTKGYNIANGGNCQGSFSDETKNKISFALKGIVFTQEEKTI